MKKSNLFLYRALKESGYESDSTLVFKRREDALSQQSQLSPQEHKAAYKTIQKGGEVPLHGLRKPAPERPKGKKCSNLTSINRNYLQLKLVVVFYCLKNN